ncbi:tRNA lysidine(34) synthetase TilS [Sphingomonas sp. MMS12-HWE2-04]|uniref:tRNA lysidine(34) synthetase TilS n=1 Tax=Sphingomonas sp. MMS12-HWE2-04 TaxID=3234199 RepID=UPI00384A6E2D
MEAVTGAPPLPERGLGVAVSGGADSVALLLLAAAAYPGAVRAATFDHGLRAELAEEAALVAALCAGLDVAHAILPPPPRAAFAGNVQERARSLRYAALARWARAGDIRWVALGHQRNDVAETFLMRSRRGSGVGGLAAMRRVRPLEPSSPSPLLLRPLLDWSREELAAVPKCLGIAVVQDPSNADQRYDRARIRALIADSPELVPSRLALSAQNLRHAEDALDWAFRREAAHCVAEGAEIRFDPAGLPYELRRRLVRHAVQHVRTASGIEAPWHEQGLDRLVGALDAGDTGTIAGVKASPKNGQWRFGAAPPRRSH